MDDFDFDQFNNTAAWLEYCEGLSRYKAEVEAARRQGVKRHDAIRMGNIEGRRNNCSSSQRHPADHLPGVQQQQAKQKGSVPVGDVQAGRGSVDVLALSVVGGQIL